MKNPFTSLFFASIIMAFLTLTFGSCNQKDTTAKGALIIDKISAANTDTCLKCLTTSVKGDSTGNFLIDMNYDNGKNIYYKKDVATIYYTTSFETYNNPKCGTGFCSVSMMIQNMIGKEFSFSGSFNYGGRDTTINDIKVPAKGNMDLGKIFSGSSLSSCEPPYVSFKLKGNISYN